MKMLRVPLLLIGLLLCSQSFADTAQQNKMTACNAEASAKTLKGDEQLPESQASDHTAGKNEKL